MKSKIIEVTPENIQDHPQIICFINPKHPSYNHKIAWFQKRFEEGLRIKLLYLEGEKKPIGFIEYIPGEQCWRPVNAEGYTFIHCLWTNGKKFQHQGLGEQLVNEVEKNAKGTKGVAVITSKKAFMATSELFLKMGYESVESSGKEQLLVKRFEDTPVPTIRDWQAELTKHTDGLTILYSKQCPWVARFIDEVQPLLTEKGITATITEITSAEQAQNAPSLYGTFALIWNGKLLADRYISLTRFKNILKKDMNIY